MLVFTQTFGDPFWYLHLLWWVCIWTTWFRSLYTFAVLFVYQINRNRNVRQPFCMYYATEGINFCDFLEMTTQPAICTLLACLFLAIDCKTLQISQNGRERVKKFRTNLGISGQGQNFRTFQDKYFSGISGQVGSLISTLVLCPSWPTVTAPMT